MKLWGDDMKHTPWLPSIEVMTFSMPPTAVAMGETELTLLFLTAVCPSIITSKLSIKNLKPHRTLEGKMTVAGNHKYKSNHCPARTNHYCPDTERGDLLSCESPLHTLPFSHVPPQSSVKGSLKPPFPTLPSINTLCLLFLFELSLGALVVHHCWCFSCYGTNVYRRRAEVQSVFLHWNTPIALLMSLLKQVLSKCFAVELQNRLFALLGEAAGVS